MAFNQFLLDQALATARAEKAMMRRMSRKASVRRSLRAVKRQASRFQGQEN